jgi:hypothetical protein
MQLFFCKNRFIGFISLCIFSFPAFSASGHMYAGMSFAGSHANLSKNTPEITYLSGVQITDDYPLNDSNKSRAVVSLNGGYEFPGACWMPNIAVGLGFYTTPVDYHLKGQVIETVAGDPSATLYNYTYDINSTRLMAEVQFTWMVNKLSPFISLGAGSVWNRMNDYTETPVDNTGFVAQPPFRSNTNVNFAYQAGFGFTTAFNFAKSSSDFLQERISIGYRYANLGHTSFATRGITYPFSLKTGVLTTNDIYISYTHLF